MKKRSILFVDDDRNVLQAYKRSLRAKRDVWQMDFESSPLKALERLRSHAYAAVVTDVRMPELSGLELLKVIKADPNLSDVDVIVVTGEADKHLKRQALNLNAADLLNKPLDTEDLAARLHSVLRLRQYSDQLKQANESLEQKVRERTAELNASRIDILWRLGRAAEFRDTETGHHVVRVGNYSRIVAEQMGFDDAFCETLFLAAPLHDIGKIGIPDAVLNKPGGLTEDEWNTMRSHCLMGVSILTEPCNSTHLVAAGIPASGKTFTNPVIKMAAVIAGSHHEKWDGSGYPHGIAGDAIPIVGRIVAIADVYDALRSSRPYKESMTVEQSIQILRDGSGKHFDPNVVEAFFGAFEKVRAVEEEFKDVNGTVALPANFGPTLLGSAPPPITPAR